MGAGLGSASAQERDRVELVGQARDWRGVDVKGRAVDTRAFRGKVLLVFINSPELKGETRPLTEQLVLRYGDNPKVAQLTLVDLSDAPLTWRGAEAVSGAVTDEVGKVHDWTVQHIQGWLEKNDKPRIPGLHKRLHIILDWERSLIGRYRTWDTSRTVTIALLDQQGRYLGSFKGSQLEQLMNAVDATLGR